MHFDVRSEPADRRQQMHRTAPARRREGPLTLAGLSGHTTSALFGSGSGGAAAGGARFTFNARKKKGLSGVVKAS